MKEINLKQMKLRKFKAIINEKGLDDFGASGISMYF